MNFLVNEKQCVKNQKTERSKQSSEFLRRCFKIDLTVISFCVIYELNSAFTYRNL